VKRTNFVGMSYRYPIVLTPDPDGGFVVSVPALPEVCTQGETEAEALSNAREAIELAIEHRVAEGDAVPDGTGSLIKEVEIATRSAA
jgi:antitoxin HicB